MWFQYISCYGLSCDLLQGKGFSLKFQYISCYGLSYTAGAEGWNCIRFNTSHVTVYRMGIYKGRCIRRVSIHLMLRFIITIRNITKDTMMFQYISCYGLSTEKDYISRNRLVFQYISCYGLSVIRMKTVKFILSFNTSHVTVYLQA